MRMARSRSTRAPNRPEQTKVELAACTGWTVLTLRPRLLGQRAYSRRLVDTTGHRESSITRKGGGLAERLLVAVRCLNSACIRPRENRSLEPAGQPGAAQRFLIGGITADSTLWAVRQHAGALNDGTATREARLADGSCVMTVELRT